MTDSDTGKQVLTKDGRWIVKMLKRLAWDNKVPVRIRLGAIDRLVLIYNKFEIKLGPLMGFVKNRRSEMNTRKATLGAKRVR
jgi:hypothetical protein